MTLARVFVIKIKADETFDYQGLEKEIYKAVSSNGINMKSMVLILNHHNQWLIFDPGKRVFSGLSAILDFEIINFREYDCSMDTALPNCQVVELFLTVDTSRKLQNGVNIDVSIDRLTFPNFYSNNDNFQGNGYFKKWCHCHFRSNIRY